MQHLDWINDQYKMRRVMLSALQVSCMLENVKPQEQKNRHQENRTRKKKTRGRRGEAAALNLAYGRSPRCISRLIAAIRNRKGTCAFCIRWC